MGSKGKLTKTWPRGYTGLNSFGFRLRAKYRMPKLLADEDKDMCDYVDGAEWWIARSVKSVRAIQRKFSRGDIAITLIEKTGALLELGHLPNVGQYLIAIQLVRSGQDWDLDLTLDELGIEPVMTWDGDDVTPSDFDTE